MTSPVILSYAHEPHTTATHLERVARALGCDVRHDGPEGTVSVASTRDDTGLVWVESGRPWVPAAEWFDLRPTAAWMIDTHRGWDWHVRFARAFDYVFTAQRSAAFRMRAAGLPAEWLPLAVPDDIAGPGEPLVDRPYDVAFVGNVPRNGLRSRVLKAVADRFAMAPAGGFLEPAAMLDLYRQARVVVNVAIADDLNMRVFEAAGSRAQLVTASVDGLFEVVPASYPHIVSDREDVGAWTSAIERALADGCAQDRVDDGYEHVMTRHTYRERAGRIIDVLDTSPRSTASRHERHVALLSAAARYGLDEPAPWPATTVRDRAFLHLYRAGWSVARAVNRRLSLRLDEHREAVPHDLPECNGGHHHAAS